MIGQGFLTKKIFLANLSQINLVIQLGEQKTECVLSIFALLVLLSFTFVGSVGASSEIWSKTYGNGKESGNSLVETSDGGYELAGLASGAIGTEAYLDSWMIKTEASGNEIWNQTFAETGDQYIYIMVETSDGTFVLAGWRTYTSTGPAYLWIIKTEEYGIIPEFPSWAILPLVLAITLFSIIIKGKLLKKIDG